MPTDRGSAGAGAGPGPVRRMRRLYLLVILTQSAVVAGLWAFSRWFGS